MDDRISFEIPAGMELLPRLIGRISGFMVSQALYVTAKLGVADHLFTGPLSLDELAARTGAHGPSLYRFLRALASLEIYEEVEPGRFANTPQSELLRTDAPGSLRHFAILMNEEMYRAFAEALHSVRTGEPAFEHVFGEHYFAYLAEHPEAGESFNRALGNIVARHLLPLSSYEWTGARMVVDVGGGNGSLLAAVLGQNPGLRGILYDQPHVVAAARPQLEAAGVADRCELVGGDFFKQVPSGGDVYIVAAVLHDWDDERAATILRNCRDAMVPTGRLLVLEQVLAAGNEPDAAKLYDLLMLIVAGGRERTEAEWRHVLDAGGFALKRVIPSPWSSILECAPA